MARKGASTAGRKGGVALVKISVGLDELTWLRLRSWALLRRASASDLVAELIRDATAKVRLPSELGESAEGAG